MTPAEIEQWYADNPQRDGLFGRCFNVVFGAIAAIATVGQKR